MTAFKYVNLAAPVLLTNPVNGSAQTLTVGSTSSFPAPPFLLGIDRGTPDEEVVLCTAKTATTFTVTRGYDNTTGVAHAVGALVEHTTSAIVHRRAGIAQVTTAERDALSGVDIWNGRTVFNTSTSKLQYWNGSAWVNVGPRSGAIEAYAGASAPPGAFLCQGQAISRTTYADLFAAIGTAFGVGDGSTTFNIPDLQQRFPVGAQAGGDYDLGDTGGQEEVTLTEAQLPNHTHTLSAHTHAIGSHSHGRGSLSVSSNGSHSHSSGSLTVPEGGAHTHSARGKVGIIEEDHTNIDRYTASHNQPGSFTDDGMILGTGSSHTHSISGSTSSVGSHSHSLSGSTASENLGNTGSAGSGNTGSVGSGEAHENRPPFLALNFIIYV